MRRTRRTARWSYTYNTDGTLATKTDAKGLVIGYTYDSQKRLLTFGVKTNGVITPAYTFQYDTGGGSNTAGRLAKITYLNYINYGSSVVDDQIVESYSYTAAGQASGKSVAIGRCPTVRLIAPGPAR